MMVGERILVIPYACLCDVDPGVAECAPKDSLYLQANHGSDCTNVWFGRSACNVNGVTPVPRRIGRAKGHATCTLPPSVKGFGAARNPALVYGVLRA